MNLKTWALRQGIIGPGKFPVLMDDSPIDFSLRFKHRNSKFVFSGYDQTSLLKEFYYEPVVGDPLVMYDYNTKRYSCNDPRIDDFLSFFNGLYQNNVASNLSLEDLSFIPALEDMSEFFKNIFTANPSIVVTMYAVDILLSVVRTFFSETQSGFIQKKFIITGDQTTDALNGQGYKSDYKWSSGVIIPDDSIGKFNLTVNNPNDYSTKEDLEKIKYVYSDVGKTFNIDIPGVLKAPSYFTDALPGLDPARAHFRGQVAIEGYMATGSTPSAMYSNADADHKVEEDASGGFGHQFTIEDLSNVESPSVSGVLTWEYDLPEFIEISWSNRRNAFQYAWATPFQPNRLVASLAKPILKLQSQYNNFYSRYIRASKMSPIAIATITGYEEKKEQVLFSKQWVGYASIERNIDTNQLQSPDSWETGAYRMYTENGHYYTTITLNGVEPWSQMYGVTNVAGDGVNFSEISAVIMESISNATTYLNTKQISLSSNDTKLLQEICMLNMDSKAVLSLMHKVNESRLAFSGWVIRYINNIVSTEGEPIIIEDQSIVKTTNMQGVAYYDLIVSSSSDDSEIKRLQQILINKPTPSDDTLSGMLTYWTTIYKKYSQKTTIFTALSNWITTKISNDSTDSSFNNDYFSNLYSDMYNEGQLMKDLIPKEAIPVLTSQLIEDKNTIEYAKSIALSISKDLGANFTSQSAYDYILNNDLDIALENNKFSENFTFDYSNMDDRLNASIYQYSIVMPSMSVFDIAVDEIGQGVKKAFNFVSPFIDDILTFIVRLPGAVLRQIHTSWNNIYLGDGSSFRTNSHFTDNILAVPVYSVTVNVPGSSKSSASIKGITCESIDLPFSKWSFTQDPGNPNQFFVQVFLRLRATGIELNSDSDYIMTQAISNSMKGLIADLNLMHILLSSESTISIFPDGIDIYTLANDNFREYQNIINRHPYASFSYNSSYNPLSNLSDIAKDIVEEETENCTTGVLMGASVFAIGCLAIPFIGPVGAVAAGLGLSVVADNMFRKTELQNQSVDTILKYDSLASSKFNAYFSASSLNKTLADSSIKWANLINGYESQYSSARDAMEYLISNILSINNFGITNDTDSTIFPLDIDDYSPIPRYYFISQSDQEQRVKTFLSAIGLAAAIGLTMVVSIKIGSKLAPFVAGWISKKIESGRLKKYISAELDGMNSDIMSYIPEESAESELTEIKRLALELLSKLDSMSLSNNKPIITN